MVVFPDRLKQVSVEEQDGLRGGVCYDGPILQTCIANWYGCEQHLCVDDACPANTKGTLNAPPQGAYSAGCATNAYGYYNCDEDALVCGQIYDCFGCEMIGGLLVCCEFGNGQNGPIVTHHTPVDFGCYDY